MEFLTLLKNILDSFSAILYGSTMPQVPCKFHFLQKEFLFDGGSMRYTKSMLLGLLLVGGWGLPQAVVSKTITLVKATGERVEIEVGTTDPFLDVLDWIQSYLQENASIIVENQPLEKQELPQESSVFDNPQFDLTFSHAGVVLRTKAAHWRDYTIPVSKEEKKELAYIIKTLGFESLISIGQKRSALKKAGKEIDHLHPFRFLITVFNDEELKAAIHALRDRGGWVWSGFLDGITESLNDEAKGQNLLQFSSDFALRVKIDHQLILPSLQHGQWNDFLNILIDTIPRQIDPNRYNM